MEIGRGSSALAFGALLMLISLSSCSGLEGNCTEIPYDPVVTHTVVFYISIGGVPIGSISFGIFYNLAPITVLNFISLCVGNSTNPSTGDFRSYTGTRFHRTIPRFMIQGGDIQNLNGWGSDSIYNGSFADEKFLLRHHYAGWIGMANAGPDTNGCQIYITCVQTSWLDCQHIIFGKVIAGMDVVRKIEYNPTDKNDRPLKDVIITGCSLALVAQPYSVPKTPAPEENTDGNALQ